MAYIITEEDYLEHYGVKGMHWYEHIFGGILLGDKIATDLTVGNRVRKENKKRAAKGG